METTKSRKTRGLITYVTLAFFGLIFLSLSAFGASWVRLTFGHTLRENGLWRRCWEKDLLEKADHGCHVVTAKSHWLKACQTMSVMSVTASFAGLALAVASYFCHRARSFAATICLAGAAVLMFATLVVFLSEGSWTKEAGFRYSWSFALGWVGMFITAAASTAGLLADRF